MRVYVLTKDKYFKRWAELELGQDTELSDNTEGCDALIIDADSASEATPYARNVIRLSRSGKDGCLSFPLQRGRLRELISTEDLPLLALIPDERSATVGKRRIKLTAHEYSLLSLLISGGEEFTSRERISREVFGEATDGLINIYIHYLREKLETGGERIVISSRKLGYKINEKYLGGNK